MSASGTIQRHNTNTVELVGLQYLPPPEKPADFDKKFAEIVGINGETGLPWLRVVWGCDHTRYYAGEMHVWYIDPNGKYVGMPYWILENWAPPTAYSREEWEVERWGCEVPGFEITQCATVRPQPCFEHARGVGYHAKWDPTIDVLGEFPEKGVWDMAKILMDENGMPESIESAYRYAREWKFNFNRKAAMSAERRVAEYKKFYFKNQQKKREAEQLLLENRRAQMIEEIDRDIEGYVDPAYNFATTGTTPKAQNAAPTGSVLEKLKEI
jgi:hypothetical protein